jgi:hypothetical protein
MSKTGGKVKLLREKQKKFNMRNSHGGFARHSQQDTIGLSPDGDNRNGRGKVIPAAEFRIAIPADAIVHKISAVKAKDKYSFKMGVASELRRSAGRVRSVVERAWADTMDVHTEWEIVKR